VLLGISNKKLVVLAWAEISESRKVSGSTRRDLPNIRR
jgi:hypothetical protein